MQRTRYSSFALAALVAALILGGLAGWWGRAAAAQASASGFVVSLSRRALPANLGRVKAIAAGAHNSLALKADGTVVGWDDNGQPLSIPPNLTGVKAIATATHQLALKSDGTVVAWGQGRTGGTRVPAGLNNVIAIAAGTVGSMALKADGTVVEWDGLFDTRVPDGLNRVTAIAAGYGHRLALKDDGTVVAWGDNRYGQDSVPPGLKNVVAIAAGGEYQSLALRADGAVVEWSWQGYTQLPPGLSNVTAIAAGEFHALALTSEPPASPPPTNPPPECATICLRAARYYLNRVNQLPNGLVRISSSGGFNTLADTDYAPLMRMLLDGGNSAQDRFNQQFVALQLSLLSAPGHDQAVKRSQLSCFGLSFDAVSLSFGLTLNPRSSLNDLISGADFAANRANNTADLEALTRIMAQLNGDDPTGRCSTGEAPSFSSATRQSLDEAVNQHLAQYKTPGAVVGVWIPGQGSWVTARGVADVATGAPMRQDLHFRIGSNTKTFTVTALMQLADGPDPKLRLDDPVSKYLSFVPNGDQITLRMLTNMTSGLASYTQSEPFVIALLSNTQRVWQARELVDIGLALPTHFAPGQGWHYSNTNTVLLGMVIEQVTGKPLKDVFAEQIFQPLGLNHTLWPTGNLLPEPYAHGITEQTLDDTQADATNWNPSWGNAAGQLISNLDDMRIWARALGTGALLSPQMQAERLKFITIPPQTPTESYGPGLGYDNGWLGHTGALMGYTSSVYYLPEKDATIVILTNSDIAAGGDAPSIALLKAITRIVTPNNAVKRG